MEKLKLEYDEISPITNDKTVMVQEDEQGNITKLCMESGFMTHELWKNDSESHETFKAGMTSLMRDLAHKDSAGGYWYPISISTSKVIFYPAGSTEEWGWCLTPVKEIPEAEAENYPIPGRQGEFYGSVLDFDNSIVFEHTDFEKAFDTFYEIIGTSEI